MDGMTLRDSGARHGTATTAQDLLSPRQWQELRPTKYLMQGQATKEYPYGVRLVDTLEQARQGEAQRDIGDRLREHPRLIALSEYIPPVSDQPLPDIVAYGGYLSNAWSQRLRCYREGGEVGDSGAHYGSRDQALPLAVQGVVAKGQLYFAGYGPRWGGGGAAFIDPDLAGTLVLNASVMTAEQYFDVFDQENDLNPFSTPTPDAVRAENLRRALVDRSAAVNNSWYGKLVCLGGMPFEHEGKSQQIPVLAFTSPLGRDATKSHLEVVAAAKGAPAERIGRPSVSYLGIGAAGFTESGLAPDDIADYFRQAIGEDWIPSYHSAIMGGAGRRQLLAERRLDVRPSTGLQWRRQPELHRRLNLAEVSRGGAR